MGAAVCLAVLVVTSPPAAQALIDGRVAPAGAYPWMAALVSTGIRPESAPAGQFCGAVLVSPTRVVTAAHCMSVVTSPRSFRVVIGRSRLSGSDGESIPVRGWAQEPRYPRGADSSTFPYDIAVVELARRAKATPIEIVRPSEMAAMALGAPARALGFGGIRQVAPDPFTDADEVAADTLREADFSIVDAATCERVNGRYIVASVMACAIGAGNRSLTCHGDSGGPLVVPVAGTWRLVGLTSFTPAKCGAPAVPDVFASAIGMAGFVISKRPVLAPAPLARPTVTGAPRVGVRLRCSRGTWRGGKGRVNYRWFVASRTPPTPDAVAPSRQEAADIGDLAGWEVEEIPHADRPTLRVGPNEEGQRVGCLVWTRNVGGQGLAVSLPTRPVQG